MAKKLSTMPSLFLSAAVFCILALLAGCKDASKPGESGEFAIYVLPGEVLLDELPDLTRLALPRTPIVSTADILTYEHSNHRLTLAVGVAGRLDALRLPGKAFAVTVGGEPIYLGAFMAATMSRSYDGVVILWPPMSEETDLLEIQLGYPGPDFFSGEDPRSDQRILNALGRSGILR